ncbi:uncharacterized protein [Euphorbia lathyris]|uniref:uncharacterized protein n=1 Tax=Euphorbia lathyris TaxID=212925 RepID=UPI0033134FBA
MALQTVRLRRVVTSLSALHRSFYSPITSAYSPPQISISDSLSVQPSASFRFQSRSFSTPWFCPWKEDEVHKDENDAALSKDSDSKDSDSKGNDSQDSDSKGNDSTDSDSKGIRLTMEEFEDLVLSMDKVSKEKLSREEIDAMMRAKINQCKEELAKEEKDALLLSKDNDSKDDESKEKNDGWVFSLDDISKEDGDDLFKNVKPLSSYDLDSELTKEERDYTDIFKKYDMKAMMAKAKEQEEKEAEEYKEYEGYNFMRRREEEYPFNFFEDEEPRVPKNEDDIMEIFAGCDLKHWLVTVDFPDPPPEPKEMIATYERVCAEGLGISIEEAKKRIYACSTTVYEGFQVEMTKEESEKFVDVPEALLILPDSFMDRKNMEYGGDKYENGVITPRPPPFTYKKKASKKKDNKGDKSSEKVIMAQPPSKQGGSVGNQGANP